MIDLTKRVKSIEYAIRDVVVYAKKLEKTGKKIIYLNIGDPCKYDFDTPQHIKEAYCEAIKKGYNWYSDSKGLLELREAIVEKEKRLNNVNIDSENVVITSGISEAISMFIAAVIDKGDEVLVPGPTYPPYIAYTKFFGGKPVSYKCDEENGWQPDIEDIGNKISSKTKMLVIINPNNPTGALYNEKTIKEILNVAAEHELIVVSDEIYDQIVYEKRHVNTARVAGDIPVVVFNGFSKVYLATGWRLGYMYFYDPERKLEHLREGVEKQARIRLSVNTPAQVAAITALKGPQDHIQEMVEKLRKRRDYTWKRLNEIDGINCVKPEAAFYAFPKINLGNKWKDDKEFVLGLLKSKGVLVVFGSGFDPVYGKDHFRMVFLPPLEILEEAFNKLEDYISSK